MTCNLTQIQKNWLQKILKGLSEGMTMREVARHYDKSPQHFYKILDDAGYSEQFRVDMLLERKEILEEITSDILKLHDKGFSNRAIIAELGLADNKFLKQILENNGRKPNGRAPKPVPEKRKCSKCKELKVVGEEIILRNTGRPNSWCKECVNQATRLARKEIRAINKELRTT